MYHQRYAQLNDAEKTVEFFFGENKNYPQKQGHIFNLL